MKQTRGNDPINRVKASSREGLTKREYFAAAAMQGLIHQDGKFPFSPNEIGSMSVKMADALIEALNQEG